jgi:hypothetical protein
MQASEIIDQINQLTGGNLALEVKVSVLNSGGPALAIVGVDPIFTGDPDSGQRVSEILLTAWNDPGKG